MSEAAPSPPDLKVFDAIGDAPVDAGIVLAEEFAAVYEQGRDPLVGTPGEVLVPEEADVLLYGDGGASKTTLANDFAVHLAAGDDWLGFPIPHPARVLIIEAEGPRAMFREKIRRKLGAWSGSMYGDRLWVRQEHWGEFRFDDDDAVARWIEEHEIDVLVVGPLTAVGFDDRGTIPEVREFMRRVDAWRLRTGRRLTVVIVHHENKAGTISGAFEGVCDTLLHAEVHTRGTTLLTIEKAKWASRWHKEKLKLAWTPGEGFELVEQEERDYVTEASGYLAENGWRTSREIAPAIGANREKLEKEALEARRDLFESRTGDAAKEVGRHPSSTVWNVVEKVARTPEPPEPPGSVWVAGREGGSGGSTRRESHLPPSHPDAYARGGSHPRASSDKTTRTGSP